MQEPVASCEAYAPALAHMRPHARHTDNGMHGTLACPEQIFLVPRPVFSTDYFPVGHLYFPNENFQNFLELLFFFLASTRLSRAPVHAGRRGCPRWAISYISGKICLGRACSCVVEPAQVSRCTGQPDRCPNRLPNDSQRPNRAQGRGESGQVRASI